MRPRARKRVAFVQLLSTNRFPGNLFETCCIAASPDPGRIRRKTAQGSVFPEA